MKIFMKISLFFSLLFVFGCTVNINPEVKMIVESNSDVLIPSNGNFDFGIGYVDTNNNVIFEISNEGRKTLLLNGVPNLIKIAGTNANDFIIDESSLKSKIGYNKSSLFSITFRPETVGSKSASIQILNNDGEFPFYTFNIFGTAVNPEISVKQENTSLISGSSTFDFKEMYIGYTNKAIEFTISNIGSGDLKLNGSPNIIEISGNNSSDFIINQTLTSDSISPNSTTTFTVEFKPLNTGNKSAIISIKNNDLDEDPFTFTVKGFGIDPRIIIQDSTQNALVNGSGIYNYGDILRNNTKQETFTIKNLGSTNLELTGNPKIQVNGTGASNFVLIQPSSSTISPGSNTTFKVSFTPTSLSDYSVLVIIANNDSYDNPYTFVLKGKGVEPEIHIKNSKNIYIASGTGSYSFGNVLINNSISETFTIQNLGLYNLTLNGTPKIQISGSDASKFSVIGQPISPITPNNSTTFVVEFVPTNITIYSATISIANNDFDENPYIFTITGTGVKPEINVKQGSIDIPSGSGTFDFSNSYVGYPDQETIFTIENLGGLKLNLTGSTDKIVKSGTDAAMFIITQTSITTPILPGNNTTFSIKFSPTSAGIKTAIISIANDDADENPYTFTIKGIGLQPAPEINIRQSSINIANSTGIYDFETIKIGRSSRNIVFTIENLGVVNLNLTDSPKVKLTGSDASEFTVNSSSTATPVTPSSSTSFTITFSPTSIGLKTATVSIGNNDSDENPYTFTITGTCVLSQTLFDFNGDGYDDVIVGARGDDDGGNGSGCAFIFFGSPNPSSSISSSNADVKLVGRSSGNYFGISVSSAGDFNDDGIDDVIVGAMYDNDGKTNSGCAFIFFGSKNPASTIDASNADVKLVGAGANHYFGCAVSNAGDMNGDHIDDVIVGASNAENSGCVYLFYGKSNPASTIDASNANVKFKGDDPGDQFGSTASNAGDVNGDGFDDIIIGAWMDGDKGNLSGCAFVYFGASNLASTITTSNVGIKIIGSNTGDRFGSSVGGAGDVNGDNYDDLIVGATYDSYGGSGAGCAFIIYGSANPTSSIESANANIRIVGPHSNDLLGYSVDIIADMNNDNFDDIIIGAIGDDEGGNSAGCAYILYGGSNLSSVIYASNAQIKIVGADGTSPNGDWFGNSVSCAGDFNGDDNIDVIVGAWWDDDYSSDSGCAFIFFCNSNMPSKIDASNANVKLAGTGNKDEFGYCVSGG